MLRARLEDKLVLELFRQAHYRAAQGKKWRRDVMQFSRDLDENLLQLMDMIRCGEYAPSKFRRFQIKDPKPRLIMALPYWDRIVQQWYIEEFVKPYFVPRFIGDSYACIQCRGIHAAVDKVQAGMRSMSHKTNGHYYIVKMDVSKFFPSIDKDVLFAILSKRMVDPALIELTRVIIFDGEPHDGLPIGDLASQYFANIYLNELD